MLSNVETNIMLQASQYGTAVFQALIIYYKKHYLHKMRAVYRCKH